MGAELYWNTNSLRGKHNCLGYHISCERLRFVIQYMVKQNTLRPNKTKYHRDGLISRIFIFGFYHCFTTSLLSKVQVSHQLTIGPCIFVIMPPNITDTVFLAQTVKSQWDRMRIPFEINVMLLKICTNVAIYFRKFCVKTFLSIIFVLSFARVLACVWLTLAHLRTSNV